MNEKEKKLKTIEIENFVWIIYIGIIFMSWYANEKEKHFLIYNDEESRKIYQNTIIVIFAILFLVYVYFTKDAYDDIKNLNSHHTSKKKMLTFASFIGSFLILISGIIFLLIAVLDNKIETEIAFN